MLFFEKMDYLMKLTNTSNKQLATALVVDPSLISRMRQGQRRPTRNNEYVQAMSEYFIRKITTDYQRSALAEAIGQPRLRIVLKNEVLRSIIKEWLSGNIADNGQPIEKLIDNAVNTVFKKETLPSVLAGDSEVNRCRNSYVYYGNQGKRAALRAFISYLHKADAPCCISLLCDESLEWIVESKEFGMEIDRGLRELSVKGYTFRRIEERLKSKEEAVESFIRWLPVYLSGNMRSYFYPRMRDNVYHRTIIAAPGIAAMMSNSIGFRTESDLTFFHLDPLIANAAVREFDAYVAKCTPAAMMHTHNDGVEPLLDCLHRYIKTPGNSTVKCFGLPVLLTPASLLRRVFSQNSKAYDDFSEIKKDYLESLKFDNKTEIITLASAEEVLSGKASCLASKLAAGSEPYFYTVKEYISHLEMVLQTMVRFQNYTVSLPDSSTEGSIIVVEGKVSAIFRTNDPITIFEVTEQNIIAAATDYVEYLADTAGGQKELRCEETKKQIQKLILELKEKESKKAEEILSK